MTVEKLAGEHALLPVNPLLANPVYLAGYELKKENHAISRAELARRLELWE